MSVLLLLSMARPRGRSVVVTAFSSSSPSSINTNQRTRQASISVTPTTNGADRSRSYSASKWNNNPNNIFIWKSRRQSFSSIFMSGDDGDDSGNDSDSDDSAPSKTLDSEWDMKGLKQEIGRLTMRMIKKVGKSSTRLRKAQELVEKLMADDNATDEQLDACPNMDALELELKEVQTRLQSLNQLNDFVLTMKGSAVVLPKEIAQLALDLEVDDQPPQRQVRGPKKQKGPREKNPPKTRLPYRRFYAVDKTEIRVGKQAEDNDELSMSSEHRAGSDWWMHASGCPGSHVVIRRSDQTLDNEIVQDAAALAARQSKCTGNTIKVSMTRCRDIQKPRGAKAGLVQLTGEVRSVTVNMKEAAKRLDRLDETLVIN